MYLWGLTIDTVTCIQLVLAIGLAGDYSAHIGHTFMTVTGSRDGKPLFMRFDKQTYPGPYQILIDLYSLTSKCLPFFRGLHNITCLNGEM